MTVDVSASSAVIVSASYKPLIWCGLVMLTIIIQAVLGLIFWLRSRRRLRRKHQKPVAFDWCCRLIFVAVMSIVGAVIMCTNLILDATSRSREEAANFNQFALGIVILLLSLVGALILYICPIVKARNRRRKEGKCTVKVFDITKRKQNQCTEKEGEISEAVAETSFLVSEESNEKYGSDPVLVHEIRTNFSKKENIKILGLTILDNELFVVGVRSSEVEVYDSTEFSLTRRLNLEELKDPDDIVSCNRNKCLYIMDWKEDGQSCELLRVDPNGNLINRWKTNKYCGRLSVTDESNVILTDCFTKKLIEYSPEGKLIHEINLSPDEPKSFYPLHAIKLVANQFVVSHVLLRICHHKVGLVDVDGKVLKSFGGQRGSTEGQVNQPEYLSVDGDGFVLVADSKNSRVLLLDSNLKCKREILSKEKHGLRRPSRIYLDESNGGRLFVADNTNSV